MVNKYIHQLRTYSNSDSILFPNSLIIKKMAQPLFDVVCLALEMRQFLEIVLVEPQSADCRVGTRGKYIYSRISKQRIELPTFLQILQALSKINWSNARQTWCGI